MKVSLSINSCEGSWDSKFEQIKTIPHDLIHVDYMDDFDLLEILNRLSSHNEKFDVHIISKNTNSVVKEILQSSLLPINIFVQSEHIPLADLEKLISNYDISPALQIRTDLTKYEHILKKVSSVLLMTTVPGISGGSFDDSLFEVIPIVLKINNKLRIYVDGGVNSKNFEKINKMNVHTVVIGSYLAKSDSAQKSFTNLRSNYSGDASILSVSDPLEHHPCISSNLLIDILKIMTVERSNYVFILDKNQDLTGIITDGDLKRFLINNQEKLDINTAKVPINGDFFSYNSDSTLSDMLNSRKLSIAMGAIPIKGSDGKFKHAFKLKELLR